MDGPWEYQLQEIHRSQWCVDVWRVYLGDADERHQALHGDQKRRGHWQDRAGPETPPTPRVSRPSVQHDEPVLAVLSRGQTNISRHTAANWVSKSVIRASLRHVMLSDTCLHCNITSLPLYLMPSWITLCCITMTTSFSGYIQITRVACLQKAVPRVCVCVWWWVSEYLWYI